MVHVSLSREDAQLQRAPATFAISLRPALLLLGSLNGEELAGSQSPRDFARSLKPPLTITAVAQSFQSSPSGSKKANEPSTMTIVPA